MASGYTAAIKNGITFKEYALTCARAFGALVEMRDDPNDAPIPDEVLPSTHYRDGLAEAEVSRLSALTPEQVKAEAAKAKATFMKERAKRNAEQEALKAKYEAMLAEVRAWTPPTADHKELQQFMATQITESIDWDCRPSKAPDLSGYEPAAWYADALSSARRTVDYHREAWEKEQQRAAERTAWIRALKASLPA